MDSSEKPLVRKRGKTVYLLGAGFSRPAGGLIMSTFGTEAFRYLKDKTHHLDETFARVINRERAICELLGLNIYNIEHLFSLVDMPGEEEKDGVNSREQLIQVIIAATQEAFHRRCIEIDDPSGFGECVVPHHHVVSDYLKPRKERCIHNPAGGACVYEAFLCKILNDQASRRPSNEKEKRTKESKKTKHQDKAGSFNEDDLDAIITLNWDLLIERMVYERFKDIRLFYGDKIVEVGKKPEKNNDILITTCPRTKEDAIKTILLLKLHGSFNWRRVEGTASVRIVKGWESKDKTLISAVKKTKTPPLIFPTWRRESREAGVFSRLTDLAIHQLRLAEKIVVIGYSMPESDAYFRYLMARGLETAESPEVEVWDIQPKDAMKSKLSALFGKAAIDSQRMTYSDKGLLGFVKSNPIDNGET